MTVAAASGGATTLDIVVAIIAGAALALSIIGLLLQFLLWRFSGARVKVVAYRAFIVGSGATQDVLTVKASNRGREAAQVTLWWLEPGNGKQHAWMGSAMLPGSDALPVRLEAGHSVSWIVPWGAVIEMSQTTSSADFRPGVALGSGTERKGKLHPV